MFLLFGIIIALVGLIGIFLGAPTDESHPLIKKIGGKVAGGKILGIGIGIALIQGIAFWNPAGTITAVQYPWGGDKMITTQGFKLKWWGRTINMSYEISLQDKIIKKTPGESDDDYQERRYKELTSKDGIYNRLADKWEFSDAIKADIGTAIVIEIITTDEDAFLSMADRNRSEGKLIHGRVLPNIDAALKNTCKLMDAQDYISGKASDFDRYFRDQLENGMYLVEEYYETENLPEIIGDSTTVRTVGSASRNGKRASKQKKFRIKRGANNEPLRDNTSNSLSKYGIKFIQAQVTGIDWEPSFDQRLDLQKDEVAKTQLEKQEAERQYYTAKKNIAQAESNKAKRRGELELIQVEKTIAAETNAKVAAQNLIAEKKQYEVEIYKAKSKKVAADATYYENIKRVQAGLTPQEKLKGDIQMNKDKWDNISKWNLPTTYFAGSSGTGKEGSDLLTNLIAADYAKNMNKKN